MEEDKRLEDMSIDELIRAIYLGVGAGVMIATVVMIVVFMLVVGVIEIWEAIA